MKYLVSISIILFTYQISFAQVTCSIVTDQSYSNRYLSENTNELYLIQDLDEKPMLIEGDGELIGYLNSNITYPEKKNRNKTKGSLYIGFTVSIEGKTSNIKILDGVNPYLDYEAVQTIMKFPKFIPGKKDNVSVNMQL